MTNEPITGFFSRHDSFDLDGDGATSNDERAVFATLNVDGDQFLTFHDADIVQRNFTTGRQQAVERLLASSASYNQRYSEGLEKRPFRGFLTNAHNRTLAESTARLAHAFAPPGSAQQQRAGAALLGLRAAPAKPILR